MTILDELRRGLSTASALETESVGSRLVRGLPVDCALALEGDLGAGKTTLVRGIARGLGISSHVTSPTYNIYTIYQGSRQLLHMDAYRLASSGELESLTIEEFLKSPFLIAVEWPTHIPEFFADYRTFRIHMELRPDHSHWLQLIPGAEYG